jgi:hypothetical protein
MRNIIGAGWRNQFKDPLIIESYINGPVYP